METTKRADQVALGEFVKVSPNESGRVTRLCRNPHHGWIGFELNDSSRFLGWFKPEQEVIVVSRPSRPWSCTPYVEDCNYVNRITKALG